jgi:broad specificity phosphatase PhoE
VVGVSHGDPIKALTLYLLGFAPRRLRPHRAPAGLHHHLRGGDWGAKLIRLNETLPE